MFDHPALQPDPNPVPQPAEALPNGSTGFDTIQKDAAPFRTVPQGSESFGNVPHVAESFGTVPNASEPFRTSSVRRENCTLTVREVARLFETAGVARSERSITNWCQPNRQGIARLEAYFDPNERRYFITPQSVEAAITEEKVRATKANAELLPQTAESFRTLPHDAETKRKEDKRDSGEVEELKKENRDLQITNRSKDLFIERLAKEREEILNQLIEKSRTVGQLETKLLGLETRAGGNI